MHSSRRSHKGQAVCGKWILGIDPGVPCPEAAGCSESWVLLCVTIDIREIVLKMNHLCENNSPPSLNQASNGNYRNAP